MKHPILYRIAMYSIIAGLCGSVMFLISKMNEAPFSSKDMRDAYLSGCNFGGSRPLTNLHVAKCSSVADSYKDTLDDLDKQMEKYLDRF